MNFKKLVVPIVLSVAIFSSCKNTLNVQAPYKDITVVYSLMDQNDAVHYIRINKGFEGNGNAYTMAKQYDSLYYPIGSITAFLEDSNPNTDIIVNKIKLDTTTMVPLSPGIFSYPKQLLYYTNATLNPNDYYNIIITNTKTGKILRGSTSLLSDVSFPSLSNPSSPLTLVSSPFSTTIGWAPTPSAQIYQMTLLFYYDNQVGSGPRTLQAPLQLLFAQQTVPTTGASQMSYNLSCQQLFTLITSSLQPELGVTRHADSLGIIFTSGTADLNTYIQLSQPPTGINQDVPSFSDVSNGVGLYTARHIQTLYRKIDKFTLDSIEGVDEEPKFKALGFMTPQ